MPRVSVICGSYNSCSAFSFEDSLKSILDQTFKDFEFIICSDGSTDKSPEVLRKYAAEDSRIRLIENSKNRGLAYSLNKCIAASVGEYIARHDLDDISEPERFAVQVEYLDSHPEISVLGCSAKLFDEKGIFGEVSFPESITKRDFLFSSPFQHGAVMFRRAPLISAGCYRVAKETRRTEDYDLFMRMALTEKMANLPLPLYRFLEDENTHRRRKYKDKVAEAKIRWHGFRKLGLLPRGIFHVIKPLIVGLIPRRLLLWMKNKFLKRRKTVQTGAEDKE